MKATISKTLDFAIVVALKFTATKKLKDYWSRLVSINATSGVLHPMVHDHPISGRRSVYLHLGMTGGILERSLDSDGGWRLLEHDELLKVFRSYNELLNSGFGLNGNDGKYAMSYPYRQGDCIFIDNWAIAHRASPEAHMDQSKQGLRILHRTTVKSPRPGPLPPKGLPSIATQELLMSADRGEGVFVAGGLGFRWDPNIHMQNWSHWSWFWVLQNELILNHLEPSVRWETPNRLATSCKFQQSLTGVKSWLGDFSYL